MTSSLQNPTFSHAYLTRVYSAALGVNPPPPCIRQRDKNTATGRQHTEIHGLMSMDPLTHRGYSSHLLVSTHSHSHTSAPSHSGTQSHTGPYTCPINTVTTVSYTHRYSTTGMITTNIITPPGLYNHTSICLHTGTYPTIITESHINTQSHHFPLHTHTHPGGVHTVSSGHTAHPHPQLKASLTKHTISPSACYSA